MADDGKKIVDFDAGETFDGETIVFENPFKLDGVVYEKATVRMATGADVEKYVTSKLPWDTFGTLTAFTGVPVAALQRLSGPDFRKLDKTLGKFLWGSRLTAGTS